MLHVRFGRVSSFPVAKSTLAHSRAATFLATALRLLLQRLRVLLNFPVLYIMPLICLLCLSRATCFLLSVCSEYSMI